MVEKGILDAVCLSFFLLTTVHLGLSIWCLGFCLGPHRSLEGGVKTQVCEDSNTNRSVAVCQASRLLEQYPWLSGEHICAHSIYIHPHIYGRYTHKYLYTYVYTTCVIQPEVEDWVKVIQTTKILTEKVLSDSTDFTQGLSSILGI